MALPFLAIIVARFAAHVAPDHRALPAKFTFSVADTARPAQGPHTERPRRAPADHPVAQPVGLGDAALRAQLPPFAHAPRPQAHHASSPRRAGGRQRCTTVSRASICGTVAAP